MIPCIHTAQIRDARTAEPPRCLGRASCRPRYRAKIPPSFIIYKNISINQSIYLSIYIYVHSFARSPCPRSQTRCKPALLLPWYLGRSSCCLHTPRRRRCRWHACRRLPPRSRETRLAQFSQDHRFLSFSVFSSSLPIRRRDMTRTCHHIGILVECTRACNPKTGGLQSRLQLEDTCARGYSYILFNGHL
jgi:hypothetical protein